MNRSALEGDAEADLVVLGAGLTGCVAALEAGRRGKKAVVLEAGRVGCGASALDVGHVAVGLDMPYRTAVERFGREQARGIWELQREGHARLEEVLSELGEDCGHRADGGFRVAYGRDDAAALVDSEDLLREDGFSGEFFDDYMLEARFDVQGFAGAYWSAADGAIETRKLVETLASAAEGRGAVFHEASPAVDLDLSPRGVEAVTRRGRVRAARAVIALDAMARFHAPGLAERLVLLAGESVVLEMDPAASLPSPGRTLDGRLVWRSGAEGFVVGRLAPAGAEAPSDAAADFARAHFAGVSSRVLRHASVATTASADGLPLIGPLPGLAAAVSCGYGGLALVHALLGARWAVQALLTGRDPTPAPFRASRALKGIR